MKIQNIVAGFLMATATLFTACDSGSSSNPDSSGTGSSSSAAAVGSSAETGISSSIAASSSSAGGDGGSISAASSSAGDGNASGSEIAVIVNKASIAIDEANHVVVVYEPFCTLSGGSAVYDAKGDGIPWDMHYSISNDTLVFTYYDQVSLNDTTGVWTVDSSVTDTDIFVGSSDDIFGTWTRLDPGDGFTVNMKISEDSIMEFSGSFSCPVKEVASEYDYDIVDSIDCDQAVVSVGGTDAVLKVENNSTIQTSYSVTKGTTTCTYTETEIDFFPASFCTVENLKNGYIESDGGSSYYEKTNSEDFESCMQTMTSASSVAAKKVARQAQKSRLRRLKWFR